MLRFSDQSIRIHHMSKNQDDRSSDVACRSRTDGQTDKQTDRQTDRQTAVTNILCKNLRFCKVTNKVIAITLLCKIKQGTYMASISGNLVCFVASIKFVSISAVIVNFVEHC